MSAMEERRQWTGDLASWNQHVIECNGADCEWMGPPPSVYLESAQTVRRNATDRQVAEYAREYVAAFDALDENRLASGWQQYHIRLDHAQRVLWGACGHVEGWPETENEAAR